MGSNLSKYLELVKLPFNPKNVNNFLFSSHNQPQASSLCHTLLLLSVSHILKHLKFFENILIFHLILFLFEEQHCLGLLLL